jgi:thiosulfate reductase cytochrome b subunit
MPTVEAASPAPTRRLLYYRHRLPVRIMHWINVLCLMVLLPSGLGIFNAHPSLYWGKSSYSARPALLEISARTEAAPAHPASAAEEPDDAAPDDDAGAPRGILRIGRHEFDTTGLLGVSTKADGTPNEQAFPSWLTVPGHYSLSESRLWHFFFAWLFVLNGLAYVGYLVASGHLRRDLLPDTAEVRGIGPSIVDHLKFKHPQGDAARRYNVLQKIAYLVVIFVLLPLIVLMGMAMSPMLDAVFSGWVDWFGGRQSARTIHFIVALLLVGFVLIHVFEVIVSGLWNHMRSMITGYYRIDAGDGKGDQS